MKKDKDTGLVYAEWIAPSPEAVFILVHGLGAHTGRWEHLAKFFLKNRISSFAIELRGFGETDSLKGDIDSFKTYIYDICRLRDIALSKNKGKPIFLVGESAGAVITFLTAATKDKLFNGLVCISPAFRSKIKNSFIDYIKVLTPLFYNPRKQFTIPFSSHMCTRDDGLRRILDTDPREHRFATSRFIFELIKTSLHSSALGKKISMPVLFLIPGDDSMIEHRVSREVFIGISADDKEIKEYPGMYHALSIDLGRNRVFKDILDWVKKKI